MAPRHVIPAIAIAAWLAGLVAFSVSEGLPTRRGAVLAWIALAVLAIGITRPRSTVRSFATTWLPLFGALIAYDLLRGISDGPQSRAHTWPQLHLDQWLGAGTTPTERLQDAFWNPGAPRWWDYLAWGVYQTHYLVPLLLAVVLWGLRHELSNRYLVAIAALSWLGLATYASYPAQPPWMTARDGLTGDVDRIVRHVWQDVGVDRAARVFTTERADGSRYSNPVAALPSLHAAFPMLVAVFLRGIDRRLDALLAAYVLAMGMTLVYAGEHFLFDIALGWLYAVAIAAVTLRYQVRTPSNSMPPPLPQAAVAGSGGSAGTSLAPPGGTSRNTACPQGAATLS